MQPAAFAPCRSAIFRATGALKKIDNKENYTSDTREALWKHSSEVGEPIYIIFENRDLKRELIFRLHLSLRGNVAINSNLLKYLKEFNLV